MSRSSFKGPFFNPKISLKKKNTIRILTKNVTILPEYVNKVFKVYNGKLWVKRIVIKDMVGYLFGEFIYTRIFNKYKK